MFISGCLVDKFFEQAAGMFAFHTFGVPLDAQYKGVLPGLDSLNEVLFRPGIDTKLIPDLFYRLMVETVHLYGSFAQDLK